MEYKPDWEIVKKRFEALWHQDMIDRCCLAVTAPKSGSEDYWHSRGKNDLYNAGSMVTSRHMNDPEKVLNSKLEVFENTYYGGEAIPQIWLNFGPAGQAAYFDAPYTVSDVTTWYSPIIEDWEDNPLRFNPQNQILTWQREMASYLAEKAQQRFFVSTADNAGCLDALASLRETQNLLMDLLADPEPVKQALQEVMRVWNQTRKELFALTKANNDGGSTVGWLSLWAKGEMSQLQSDISVMLSKELFQQFVLPELEWSTQQQDYSLYHLDGIAQLRHLDDILSVKKIHMIQWVSVVGEPSYLNYLPVFQKIQQSGKSLLINDVKPEDIPTLLTNLSAKGLLLMTQTDTQAEAEDLLALATSLSRP